MGTINKRKKKTRGNGEGTIYYSNRNKTWVGQYTVNGKIIEVKSVIGYSTSDYVVGQKVEIFYNPNKEDEIYIEK